MKEARQTQAERLYTLLGDLPPSLLADAFPEGDGSAITSPQSKHIRRIGRAILTYAACIALLVGVILYMPKLIQSIGSSDAAKTTTAVTTADTTIDRDVVYNPNADFTDDIWNIPYGSYSPKESNFKLQDYTDIALRNPLHDIPQSYTYPKETHPFYIDHGIYLDEDFYRPDLIWGSPVIAYALNTTEDNYWVLGVPFDNDYPEARYAITMLESTSPCAEKCISYLTDLGWEYVTNCPGILTCVGEGEYLVFAATIDQIIEFDYDTFVKTVDRLPYGTIYGAYTVKNLYDPERYIG